MKITDTKIDGFGVWNDLQLTNLSGRVTVFYGANEAGKTTLMQFIRSVMYGMSPERRERYLPPVAGGRPGGTLGIVDGEDRFELTRIADRGPDDMGLATITTQDGQTGGDRLLREALSEVDENDLQQRVCHWSARNPRTGYAFGTSSCRIAVSTYLGCGSGESFMM